MKEEPWKENIEWHDDKTCTLQFIEKKPLFDRENKLVGHTDNETVVKTTYEELKENLDNRVTTRDNIKKQLDVANQKKDRIGKKPHKTSEMVRLEKALQDLSKINALNEVEKQIEQHEKDLDREEQFISARQKSLDKRPKGGGKK